MGGGEGEFGGWDMGGVGRGIIMTKKIFSRYRVIQYTCWHFWRNNSWLLLSPVQKYKSVISYEILTLSSLEFYPVVDGS